MRKKLLIFLLGISCGILYTENAGFKSFVDRNYNEGKKTVSSWLDTAQGMKKKKVFIELK